MHSWDAEPSRKTQDEVVYDRIQELGYVDNFWAIKNRILRLGAIIHTLRHRDGMDLVTATGKELGKPRPEWKNTYYLRPEVHAALMSRKVSNLF